MNVNKTPVKHCFSSPQEIVIQTRLKRAFDKDFTAVIPNCSFLETQSDSETLQRPGFTIQFSSFETRTSIPYKRRVKAP